jgi:hypothetical protein
MLPGNLRMARQTRFTSRIPKCLTRVSSFGPPSTRGGSFPFERGTVVYSLFVIVALLVLTVFSTTISVQAYNSKDNQSNPLAPTLSPVNLSNDSPVDAEFPMVASVGSNVYVSWSESSGGIKFRASLDYGQQWLPSVSSPALTVSPQGGEYGIVQFPVMCANASDVFIAWSQAVGSSGLQIFEATSLNNGSSFSVTQLTFSDGEGSTTKGGYITPAIAASGPNVYVTFSGNGSNSYVMSSNNYGSTWGIPYLYSHSLEDEVAAWGNNGYALANRALAVSHNAGETWTASIYNATLKGDEPMIAVYESDVYVVSESSHVTGNQGYIHAYVSNNNGDTFKTFNDFSPTVNDSWAPMVGAFGNSSWVALRAHPGGPKGEVWVYTSSDGGQKWSVPYSLSGPGASGTSETFPFEVASTDGQNVFVGWAHQVSPGYWTFMVGASNDGGTTWSTPPGINTSQNANGEAGFENDLAVAAISSSGQYCYAVWQYRNATENQIFFGSITY